ncbi:protein of unknown function [Hyphomicrobium sp. 1Nfss2.1]
MTYRFLARRQVLRVADASFARLAPISKFALLLNRANTYRSGFRRLLGAALRHWGEQIRSLQTWSALEASASPPLPPWPV